MGPKSSKNDGGGGGRAAGKKPLSDDDGKAGERFAKGGRVQRIERPPVDATVNVIPAVHDPNDLFDVIVIGGGAAGIGAARTLHDAVRPSPFLLHLW
jgi:hypothetical protein